MWDRNFPFKGDEQRTTFTKPWFLDHQIFVFILKIGTWKSCCRMFPILLFSYLWLIFDLFNYYKAKIFIVSEIFWQNMVKMLFLTLFYFFAIVLAPPKMVQIPQNFAYHTIFCSRRKVEGLQIKFQKSVKTLHPSRYCIPFVDCQTFYSLDFLLNLVSK